MQNKNQILDAFKTTTKHPKNRVLSNEFKVSTNFFHSDLILRHLLKKQISAEGFDYMQDKWEKLGAEAAGRMNELSLLADKKSPELIKRNRYGETINEIEFHPAY